MNTLPAIVALLVVAAVGLLGCSGGSSCTPGMSISCTCVGGTTGAQVCASDGTFGACHCGAADAGTERDAGPTIDADGGSGRDAGLPSCDEGGAISLSAPILTNMGESIATVADVEGDERLEIVTFGSQFPSEVRIATWSGTALDGPSRQLLDLTNFDAQVVAVDDSAVPLLVGTRDPRGTPERVAYRFGPDGYEEVELRLLPEPPASARWRGVTNGVGSVYNEPYARLFASRSTWAVTTSVDGSPWYRFVAEAERVTAEQVDRDALFGADALSFGQIDGDINGDGVEDFLFLTSSDIWIVESTSDDTWRRLASIPRAMCEDFIDPGYRFALVGDLDFDGDLDLVVNRNCTAQPNGFIVALRSGDDFTIVHHSLPDDRFSLEPVALGDLDGDCYPDLLLNNGQVARNDGDGRFGAPVPPSSETSGGTAVVVDLDLDGDNDIVWYGPGYGDTGPAVQLNELR